jgi:amino acid transporter
MKWTIVQVITLIFLTLFMFILEEVSGNRTVQPSNGEWVAVYPSYSLFIVYLMVLGCFYLLFLFEAKKNKNVYSHKIWKLMPRLCVVIGIVSAILFIIGGIATPLFEWVQQLRFLLYLFFTYFMFLVFLFIFSIEHKRHNFKQSLEKTVHISFFWIVVLVMGIFFFLP